MLGSHQHFYVFWPGGTCFCDFCGIFGGKRGLWREKCSRGPKLMKKSDRSQAFPRKSVVNKHIALVYVAIVPVGRGLVDYKPYFCMDFGLTLSFGEANTRLHE
jgi:hypothetical protein